MSKSAFRISGTPRREIRAFDRLHVEAHPLIIPLIDGRTMHVMADVDGLTKATDFMTHDGATLRAEERIYCICPGVGDCRYPGVENRMTPEERMDLTRELNTTAAPSHIALRRVTTAAIARMDDGERERVLEDNFSKKALIAALCSRLGWTELVHLADTIKAAEASEAIAAE